MPLRGDWIPGRYPNGTFIPPELCTLDTCPLQEGHFEYRVSLAGNAFYLALFVLFALFQLGLGCWKRTWTYMVAMLGGLALEIMGYTARVQMHFNPFTANPFLLYLIGVTIAPAFFSACLYMIVGHMLSIYNPSLSRLSPRAWGFTFIGLDFISLVIQAAGGAIADTASSSNPKLSKTGVNIMIAGLAFQVACNGLFILLCTELLIRFRKHADLLNPKYHALRASRLWKIFIYALAVATIAIFVRSIYRCAELSGGFNGKLAQDQPSFMVLEGCLIIIATGILTFLHPAISFKGTYHDTSYSMRRRASTDNEKEQMRGTPESDSNSMKETPAA